jgi:hypothetical protein
MPDAELDFSAGTGPVAGNPAVAEAAEVPADVTDTRAESQLTVDGAPADAVPADAAPVDAVPVDAAPIDADEVLLAAVDLARTALLDITPADTIGEPVGHVVEGEHVLSLLFDCTMTGYPGWHWSVSMSRIDENSEPFVLETELMPGGDALLAPEWTPWSERLSDYRDAQDLLAAQSAADADGADDDDEFSDDELDDEALDDDELDEEELDADDEELDADIDDDDLDDEHGDDVLDGIDFETAVSGLLDAADAESAAVESGLTASELNPGQADDAESQSEDSAPEPPAEPGSDELVVEDDKPGQRH